MRVGSDRTGEVGAPTEPPRSLVPNRYLRPMRSYFPKISPGGLEAHSGTTSPQTLDHKKITTPPPTCRKPSTGGQGLV